MIASYGFDFADREATLDVTLPDLSVQPVVTGSSYAPSGPLGRLDLGNGAVEEHRFDTRYFPAEIELTAGRNHVWDYTVDGVGNPTGITERETCLPTLTLSNEVLTGTETYLACDELTASPDVTVAAGADVTFQAGQGIGLGSGFTVEEGAVLSVVAETPSPAVETRTFGYQDVQYYLTSASGAPWGALDWTYDRIGNRLTEDRNGTVDAYIYVLNGTGGNTAILSQAGTRVFTYDAAGNTTSMTAGANQVDLGVDDASRVAQFARPVATAQTDLTYDGRSFLRRSEELLGGGPDSGFAEPTYSSAGLLHALHRQSSPTDPEERSTVVYFAGRPVAQLHEESATYAWLFLTTDHLGTPSIATDLAQNETWHGPFEPFGTDFYAGTPDGALENGVLLRLPGQWDDGRWSTATMGMEVFYNVHRWYEYGTGRYSRPDPLGITELDPHPYAYVNNNPLRFIDPLGLRSWPFGAGKFCRDPSCECEPPIRVLGEDQPGFVSTPAAGQCVEADAVYSVKCVLKIPDNFKCTLKCDPGAPPGEQGTLECRSKPAIIGQLAVILFGKKPKCITQPGDVPDGWPPNPLW